MVLGTRVRRKQAARKTEINELDIFLKKVKTERKCNVCESKNKNNKYFQSILLKNERSPQCIFSMFYNTRTKMTLFFFIFSFYSYGVICRRYIHRSRSKFYATINGIPVNIIFHEKCDIDNAECFLLVVLETRVVPLVPQSPISVYSVALLGKKLGGGRQNNLFAIIKTLRGCVNVYSFCVYKITTTNLTI